MKVDGAEARGFDLEAAQSEDADLGIQLTVRRAAGDGTVLHSTDGDLVLDDLVLEVARLSGPANSQARVSIS